MSDKNPRDAFDKIAKRLQVAKSAVRMLFDELRKYEASDVLPRQPAEPETSLLSALLDLLQEIEEQAKDLDYYLIKEPIEALLFGHRMSSAQFYALRSIGIEYALEAVLSAGDGLSEYEAYRLMHYDDGHDAGLIDPAQCAPDADAKRTGARITIAPEHVTISGLRPDQHDFLESRMPEVFARFKP